MRRSLCTSRVVVGKQLNASSRSFASSVATTKKTFVPASERKEYSMEGPGDLYTPVAAMKLINEVAPIEVEGNSIRCDGGGGELGHPAVFINLNRGVQACGYCGLRFVNKHDNDHHHHH